MSIHIFLLSLLLNEERKYNIDPKIAIKSPKSPKRYPYGLKTPNEVGISV